MNGPSAHSPSQPPQPGVLSFERPAVRMNRHSDDPHVGFVEAKDKSSSTNGWMLFFNDWTQITFLACHDVVSKLEVGSDDGSKVALAKKSVMHRTCPSSGTIAAKLCPSHICMSKSRLEAHAFSCA